jgi:hypothetical protein
MMSEHSVFQNELRELPRFIKKLLLHPTQVIRAVPNYSWPTLLVLQAGFALISGFAFGLCRMSVISIFIGLFIFPISAMIASILGMLVVYYYFYFVHSTQLPVQKLYSLLVLAFFPFFLFHPVSAFVNFIHLPALLLSCALLHVGLRENFVLPTKSVTRFVVGLFVLFSLTWGWGQIRALYKRSEIRSLSPKNLDLLEDEIED